MTASWKADAMGTESPLAGGGWGRAEWWEGDAGGTLAEASDLVAAGVYIAWLTRW